MSVTLMPLDTTAGKDWAQTKVRRWHYLHQRTHQMSCVEGYAVEVTGLGRIGCLLLGRPQAQCCYPWYGAVDDVQAGRADVTRWQVLNLARVWLSRGVQAGGRWYGPQWLPGFTDRAGVWHSTLASTAIRLLIARVGYDYLLRRPPCFLDEPYEIRWLLSYCDPVVHRGTLYRVSGLEYHPVEGAEKQTWRVPLPPLTPAQDTAIRQAALFSSRSQQYRAARRVQQAVFTFSDM